MKERSGRWAVLARGIEPGFGVMLERVCDVRSLLRAIGRRGLQGRCAKRGCGGWEVWVAIERRTV